jgi:hypothetical protein
MSFVQCNYGTSQFTFGQPRQLADLVSVAKTYPAFYESTAERLPEKPEAPAIKAYKGQLGMFHLPYAPPPGP